MTSLLYSRATSSLQRWCRRILHKRGLYRWQFRRDPNLLLERSNSYVFPPSSASGCFSCVTGAVTAPCLLLSSPMSGACHLGPSTQSQLESVQHGGSAVGYTNAAQLKKIGQTAVCELPTINVVYELVCTATESSSQQTQHQLNGKGHTKKPLSIPISNSGSSHGYPIP